MNEVPPNQDPPDDIDEHYRRASALDPSRPSEAVRRAILKNAAQLAAEHTAKRNPLKADSKRQTSRTWRRPALFGTLAAASLAGLLIAPRFITSPAPPVAPPGANVSQPSMALTPAGAPDVRPSPEVRTYEPPAPAEAQSNAKLATRSGASRTATADESRTARNAEPKATDNSTRQSEIRSAADSAETIAAQSKTTAPAAPGVAPMSRARLPSDSAAALRRAAEIGDVPGMQTLFDERVNIEARDTGGRTALMLATLHGQTDAVDALLARGADPNVADARGITPLDAAVAGDQPAIVAALRRAGAR